jgi:uncharacterized membrane protein YeaQ/YmgE (transglycosylase-associated protein family)
VSFIVAVIIGGVIGWLASLIMKTNAQMGLIANIVVGVVGSLISGSTRRRSSVHRRRHGVAAVRSRVGASWRRGQASYVLSDRLRPLDDGLCGYLADDAVRRGAGTRRSKRSAEGAAYRPHGGDLSVNPP